MRRLPAFTLIEAILYLALFNVVFFAVITFTISLTQNNRTAEYKNAVEKNAIYVTQHLQDTFISGIAVDENFTEYGQDSGKIRIALSDGSYKQYSIIAGTLTVSNGTEIADLTDSLIRVTEFSLEPVRNAQNVPLGARISITFVAKKYPDTITKTVQSYYAFR